MEQAVNTFQKGLQTDTHPMTQGTDVLSDALNATFITMNGNEVVLQNDMGNRRVDNAYLPSGYQPVGMKEYGGVIYVAAYNPITNRSQIGSFPSPERKMGNEYQLQGSIDLHSSLRYPSNNCIIEDELMFLKDDSKLIRLTGDTSLHAGDKFTVYCNYSNLPKKKIKISESPEKYKQIYDISNFDNTDNNKVTSPKNRCYTLALGILNSQNEFVDITKTLQRWDSENKVMDLEDKSDLYKFNAGYFIAPGKPIVNLDYTKDDAELLAERQKLAVNTYAYKLVGPLYLKATLNHIEMASYNIYGINEDNKVILWVESVITYNCPDGMPDENTSTKNVDRGSDDNYTTYYLYRENDVTEDYDFLGFNFLYKVDGEGDWQRQDVDDPGIRVSDPNILKYSNHSYNPETNLYTITIRKKYEINVTERNESIEYYFCTAGTSSKEEGKPGLMYLRGLSEKGTIEIRLLGSGLIEIKGWRFYNNDKETILTYNLKAYPKYGKEFTNLKFKFINVANKKDTIELTQEKHGLTIFNGRNDIQFNWEREGFKPRSLYNVIISYNDGESVKDKEIKGKWFLTTELFNDCYRTSHEYYMADFAAPENNEIRERYCTIDLDFTIDRVINNSPEKTVDIEGGKILIPKQEYESNGGKINIKYTHTQDVNIDVKKSIKIKNIDLYPDYIKLNAPTTTQSCSVNYENEITFKNNNPDWTMIEVNNPDDPNNHNLKCDSTTSQDNIFITGTIKYYDIYESEGKPAVNPYIKNGFTTLDEAITKLVKNTNKFTGLYMTMAYEDVDLNAILNSSLGFGDRSTGNDLNPIDHGADDEVNFSVANNNTRSKIMEDNFNQTKNIFLWAGIQSDDFEYGEHGRDGRLWPSKSKYEYDAPSNLKYFTRIWWKTNSSPWNWAMLDKPVIIEHHNERDAYWADKENSTDWQENEMKNNVIQIIKSHFTQDALNKTYICFYRDYSLVDFIVPNPQKENYNNEYNIPASIILNITLNGETGSIGTVENVTLSEPPLTFKLRNENIPQEKQICNILLESSQKFQNIVTNTSNIPSENMTINGGINTDIHGDPLFPGNVYKETKNGLEKNDNSKIVPNNADFGEQYLGFTLNLDKVSTGVPTYQYDIRDNTNDDGRGILSYIGVPVIKEGQIDG